jgi:ABC-type branched-subunit amino acid transport system substrate-binding protein
LYTRRIDLRFVEPPEAPSERVKAIEAFIRTQEIFALIGSFLAGADREISGLLQEEQVPLVGTLTLSPQLGSPLNRYVFHLHSGVRGEAEALAAFARGKYAGRSLVLAILSSEEELSREVARAITQTLEGTAAIRELRVSRAQFDPASVARQLADQRIEAAFLVALGVPPHALLQEVHKLGWSSDFFIPGSLTTRDILDLPAGLHDRAFLAFSTRSSGDPSVGMAEYRSLAAAFELPTHHRAEQLVALSSARILGEGLLRAGREVSRESLIQALEGLYEFDTGFLPRVTYGPTRRVGILAPGVVKVDAAARKLVPVGWD